MNKQDLTTMLENAQSFNDFCLCLERWIEITGAIQANSSLHGELENILERAFDGGWEKGQRVSAGGEP